MSPVRSTVTYPAPKYGPTPVYGGCEADGCHSDARATCPTCEGHLCLSHLAHALHEANDLATVVDEE